MNLLWMLLRTSRWVVLLSILCGAASGASSAGMISLITRVLSSGGQVTRETTLQFILLGALVLTTRIGSQTLLNTLHHQVVYDLRIGLSRRFLSTPLRQLEGLGAHRLIAALNNDILAVSTGLLALPNTIINLAVVLGCLAYLAWLSWWVFLSFIAFLAVGMLTYWLPASYSLRLMKGSREAYDMLQKHFRTLTEGLKELKIHHLRRHAFLDEDLDGTANRLRRLDTTSSNIDSANASWGLFLFLGFIGLLLFALPAFGAVKFEALTGYVLTILYMQQPLDAVMGNFHGLGQSVVALRKLEALTLGVEPEVPPASENATFRRLELVGITHVYRREDDEDGRFTLGPIHLTFEPGELVFLVGGNGSGKTTLAKLIIGLYAPEGGTLLWDGEPVTDARREHYRQLFSVIFSDFHLFDRLLGLETQGRTSEVQGYLERLHLSHKVKVVDGKLSTTALSQGQRKRLALLVCWLEDRPFYVFDEWAADQDPIFKAVFYEQLLPDLKKRGKTVFVITHDDRYFHLCDRLIRLDSGQLLTDEPQRVALSQAVNSR
ncbi:cyclic peptide export ABC transporter [Archangium lipolyticum]|uniref:cyclic peptide export ABC transporter n=1 Tax=Archangium lipolyticum TaxID=2970465 RepID=UPI002149B2FD|nr:cyclic peptide export ABC transporter [Archangium lipolyticum]